MYLHNLYLRSFRNYLEQEVNFTAQKTILVGNNAQGKSNLLEAVELLATLKSHRTSRDREFIFNGAKLGQITANLERYHSKAELGIIFRLKGRKTVSLNQENLRRQLDFLGVLNAVEFSSLDLDLVRGSPEYRRRWIDSLLIQLEPIYGKILAEYERILRQRNALLKQIRHLTQNSPNLSLNSQKINFATSQLQLWNEQLAEAGSRITRRRARVIERLTPLAAKWHSKISGKTEKLEINYQPNVIWQENTPEAVQKAFLAKITSRRLAEQQQGKTVVGTHRDEIELSINQTVARYYGSQGQQRTLVLALKLAELELIEAVVGEPPLLLLDDVLAELDPQRQHQLLEAIGDRFQTLITTTHINAFDGNWLKSSQVLTVSAGKIIIPSN
ncbi:MAG: DNA replication/repair protein RecF [Cyanobacteria bacterium J083]|nr:MAG: DNA replication/repair protein RecF [Cyanobacteria bacterium J083]